MRPASFRGEKLKPRDTHFVKVLVDSGVISFKEAGSLEEQQEALLSETGESKPVWDIAVDGGMITRHQAERFLASADGPEKAAGASRKENTQELAPLKPAEAGPPAGSWAGTC